VIRGYFDLDGAPYVRVDVAVRIPSVNPDPVTIPFVIDTGAAFTCIHALDAMRWADVSPADLEPATWPADQVQRARGVGGLVSYRLLDAEFGFADEDGASITVRGRIAVGAAASGAMSALLGWDILRFFRLEIGGVRQTVILELVEGR
jgi:hypothetical protein